MQSIRVCAVIAALFVAAPRVAAVCQTLNWEPKVFDSDAVHYAAADLDGDGTAEILGASATTLSVRRHAALTPVNVYMATLIGAPITGDFDGNGTVDVVVPGTGANTLVFLPGNGDRTFGPAVATALPFSPSRIAAGNFTGSASLDVAVIGSGATLLLMQGNGVGTFTSAGQIAIAAAPHRIASANFDGDAYADLAVSHTGSTTVEIVFSNGDGTGTIVPVTDGDSGSLAAGDLDNDGDVDLIASRPLALEYGEIVNAGARTFTSALIEDVSFSGRIPGAVATGDMDQNGKLDFFAPMAGSESIRLYRQLTSFSADWWPLEPPYVPRGNLSSIATGDFDGDGSIDFVLEDAGVGRGQMFINECATTRVRWLGDIFISAGTMLEGQVHVYPPSQTGPVPTGTVTLRKDGEVLQTATLAYSSPARARAVFAGPVLPLGIHEFEIEYSGDANYAAEDNRFYVTVTDVVTTVTLTPSLEESEWGQSITFTATVTASDGGTPEGLLTLYADGQLVKQAFGTAPLTWTTNAFTAGAHTIESVFRASSTHPKGKASITYTVQKSAAEIILRRGWLSRYGEGIHLEASLRIPHFATAQGQATLHRAHAVLSPKPIGTDLVATFSFYSADVGPLPMQLAYGGDANTLPAVLKIDHVVFNSGAYFPLVAVPAATNLVVVDFIPMPDTSTRVYRKAAGGGWQFLQQSNFPVLDGTVIGGNAYQYRAEAYSTSTNALVATTEPDTVYVGTFTDSELAGAPVKALHFGEVRTAVNALRATEGLAPLTIDFTGIVQAAHLTQLRNGMNELRTALGLAPHAFADTITPGGTIVRAVHVEQLRGFTR